ncbi:hypothetical protein GCM10018785_04000 [Streptomyces longispororuber]|uniref:Secreted protein n=1 Tax=Streptomyces longispororuber TaxID=68230 RepID=A0A918Z5Z8_9ACTN|nr:hypothetical protein [Streptomyces longispororuber]GHE37486.1 hypothetical protein GCM10018785_04000 [Streptomyces longispororuber]
MPRGRHRHSPPLHRLLPPSAVAGFSLVCAGGAWLFAEPVVLRGLAAAAAASAVVGSVVMRRWDRAAGKRVAELGRVRASEEWRYEERIAECESDLDEARALRARLENKLRAKRAELAALRNEHAALLRRYATAETERASALEGQRLLAMETSSPLELTGGTPDEAVPAGTSTLTAALYGKANAALDHLTAPAEPTAKGEEGPAGPGDAPAPAEPAGDGHERAAADPVHVTVPAAAAVVPPAQVRQPAEEGGFDFFGTKSTAAKSTAPAALDAVQNEDLADVVGEEALAVHKAEAEAEFKPADATTDAERGVGQVIDLTAHDETEQIDMQGLRTALRA